jgi:hypothetical protein
LLKAELYNELRTELATKEFIRAEINGVRAEVRVEISDVRAEISGVRGEIAEIRSELKQNSLLLKILTGIAVFGLTLFNPAFVKLVELVFK